MHSSQDDPCQFHPTENLGPNHPSRGANLWTLTSASASNIAGVRSRRAIVRAPSRAATSAAAVVAARASETASPEMLRNDLG